MNCPHGEQYAHLCLYCWKEYESADPKAVLSLLQAMGDIPLYTHEPQKPTPPERK